MLKKRAFVPLLLALLLMLALASSLLIPIGLVRASDSSVTLDDPTQDGYIQKHGTSYYDDDDYCLLEMGSTLTDYTQRSYVEWNISSIPDTATITGVFFRYEGNKNAVDCHIHEMMGTRPSTSGDQAVYDEAGEGTIYAAPIGFPVVGTVRSVGLGSTAASDLEYMLTHGDWFAIGIEADYVTDGIWSEICSEEWSGANPKPTLYVVYTTEELLEPPTNVQATDGTHTDKVVITWNKSDGATEYQVYRSGVGLGWLGDVSSFDDYNAGAPSITGGTASASDGTYDAYVALSISGESVQNGATYSYTVKARSPAGTSPASGSNIGYRGHGSLMYQWQRSATDSATNYSDISGATSATYYDYDAPADGGGRYYRCVLNATGADQEYSASDRGYRAVPGKEWREVETWIDYIGISAEPSWQEVEVWTDAFQAIIFIGQPVLISPDNDSTIYDNTPTFQWIAGANALHHQFLLDNNSDFSSPTVNITLGTDTTYTITTPLADDNYWWKIIALDGGFENSSEVWTFELLTPVGKEWYDVEIWVNFASTGIPGWLGDWGYRKTQTVTGTTAGAQTNYQLKITVHKGSGTDNTTDVYCGGNCRDDFGDIRWTKNDGTTPLDYWAVMSEPIFSFDSRLADLNAFEGVASDGTYLYNSGWANLYKRNKNGSLVTSRTDCHLDGTDMGQINGIHVYGDYLYLGSNEHPDPAGVNYIKVFRRDTLEYVEEHQVKSNLLCEGCAFHDDAWWVSYCGATDAAQIVSEYDTDWDWVADYPLTFPQYEDGVAAFGYQGIVWIGDYIYMNCHGGCVIQKCDVYKWNGSGFDEIARSDQPTPQCGQGLGKEPGEDVIWWVERDNPAGSHNIVKSNFSFADESAVFWIEIPSVPASPDTVDVYMYYGKSDATTMSNGVNTFVWFDDFSTDRSDEYTTIGTGALTINTVLSRAEIDYTTAMGAFEFYPTIVNLQNLAVETRMARHTAGWMKMSYRWVDSVNMWSTWANTASEIDERPFWRKVVDGEKTKINTASNPMAEDTYYKVIAKVYGTSHILQWPDLGVDWSTTDSDINQAGKVTLYGILNDATSPQAYFDYLRIRNYASPEPTWGSWGEEETAEMGWTEVETWTDNIGGKEFQEVETWTTSINSELVVNHPPTTPTSIDITPAIAYVGSELTATASGSTDVDEDPITYYYQFYNTTDGVLLWDWSTTNTYTVATTDNADTVRVSAKAYDGQAYSEAMSEDKAISSYPKPPVSGWAAWAMFMIQIMFIGAPLCIVGWKLNKVRDPITGTMAAAHIMVCFVAIIILWFVADAIAVVVYAL